MPSKIKKIIVCEDTTRTYEIPTNVMSMLSLMGLEEKAEAFPKELSGGEQQRVAIARALVNRPRILLADEPTGNLDPKTSWEIMELLEDANKRGTTVLVVTHNNEIVDKMKKRVISLEQGLLVADVVEGSYIGPTLENNNNNSYQTYSNVETYGAFS